MQVAFLQVVLKMGLTFLFIAAFVMVPGQATPAGPGTSPPVSFEPFAVVEKQALEEMGRNDAGAAISLLKAYGPAALRLSPADFAMYNYVYAGALVAGGRLYAALEGYRLAYLFMPADRQKQKELALLKRADVYAGIGMYEEAASAYRIFLDTYGKSEFSEAAYLGLANALFKTAHYNEALQNYEKAGNSEQALSGKAAALVVTGNPKQAYALFESLAASDPGYVGRSGLARYSMGEACRLLGKVDEAKTYLGSVTGGGFAANAAYSLGLIAEAQGGAAQAAGLFLKASDSGDAVLKSQALLGLARCDLKLARPDDAIAALTGVGFNRSHQDLYYSGKLLLAEALGMKGRYMEAAAVLKGLLLKKAYAEAAMGELQDVVETAREHMVSPGGFNELWKFAGGCLMERGRARFVFAAAQRLKPVDMGEFVDINRWVARNGDRQLARQAAGNLAAYYLSEKNGREAAAYFRQAALPPREDSTLRMRAGIRYLNGNYKGAERDLLSIKALSEEDLQMLARAIPRAKDFGAAGLAAKRLRTAKLAAPPALCLSIADAMYEKGDKAEALEFYRDAAGGAAPGRQALSPQDLKWALFRLQGLEKDPKAALGSLEGHGGLMGRYAAARLDEDSLMDHYDLSDMEKARR